MTQRLKEQYINKIIPEMGHGDKKVKSYKLGCGEIVTNLLTSGLRIINCMQIRAPNEKPETHHWL